MSDQNGGYTTLESRTDDAVAVLDRLYDSGDVGESAYYTLLDAIEMIVGDGE